MLGPVVDIITNVEYLDKMDFNCSVIPNPNQGRFSLKITLISPIELKLELRNQLGQLMELRSIKTQNINHIEYFDVSSLSDGIYYLFISSNQFMGSEKIVIQ